jgi:hypothetical protein
MRKEVKSLTEMNRLHLERALEVVSMPAAEQLATLRPEWDRPFEIADDFCNWCLWARHADDSGYTQDELASLIAVEDAFKAISGRQNAHLWTEDAVHRSDEWAAIRELARRALAVLRRN